MMKLRKSSQYVVRLVPVRLVQVVANAALTRVLVRHPQLFDRLGEHRLKTFAFAPTDLPILFLIIPGKRRVSVVRRGTSARTDVCISGTITTLLALAEGRLDGDAEFFARDLAVDGDMEAIVALRNAMDDCRIDLPTDLASAMGPLRRPAEAALQALRSLLLTQGDRKWN